MKEFFKHPLTVREALKMVAILIGPLWIGSEIGHGLNSAQLMWFLLVVATADVVVMEWMGSRLFRKIVYGATKKDTVTWFSRYGLAMYVFCMLIMGTALGHLFRTGNR